MKLYRERFESVPQVVGLRHDDPDEKSSDFWLLTKWRADVIRVWWETKFAFTIATETGADASRAMEAVASNVNTDNGDPGRQYLDGVDSLAMNMDFSDDIWTRDFLSGDNDFTLETFWSGANFEDRPN